MIVYRIERPNGTGPYLFPGLLDTTTEDMTRHPMPGDDGMDTEAITAYHFFGFACLLSLRAWFDKDMREYLWGKNCNVQVYDVPDDRVLVGNSQLAFVKDASRLIKVLDIVDFSEINA